MDFRLWEHGLWRTGEDLVEKNFVIVYKELDIREHVKTSGQKGSQNGRNLMNVKMKMGNEMLYSILAN